MKNNAKKYVIGGVLGIVVIGVMFLLLLGYRIQPDFSISKDGFITLTLPLKNTIVYVDGEKKVVTEEENQTVEINASKKIHTVILGREGYLPWSKDIYVLPDQKNTLSPVFVTENTTGEIITQNDPEYWSLKNKIEIQILPTKENPIISKDGSTLWVDGNTIYVKGNYRGVMPNENITDIVTVISRTDTIRGVDFYKGRSDMVVFSSDVGVYAVDVLKNGVQNFFPLYKGIEPSFISKDEHSLYVLDGQNLMQVVI